MNSDISKRATNVRWVILTLACVTSFLTYIHRYAWGAIRPYLKADQNLSDSDLGWLDSAFNLTYALGQFPGGLAGDVFGPRAIITLAAVVWSAAAMGPALVRGFWGLFSARLVFGATQSPAYPNLGKITKTWAPLSIRTTIQGLVASFSGRAGAAAAAPLVATVMMGAMHMSWQTAICALSCSGFVYAAIFWVLFRNRPNQHPWSNEAERQLIEGKSAPQKPKKHKFDWSGRKVRNLAVFMGASFFSSAADGLFVFYMPQFLVEDKGFSPVQMGLFASLPLLGGATGGMAGGILNDVMIRVLDNRRWARRLVAATGKSLAALLIVGSLFIEDGRAVMVVLFFCKFFSDWSQPTWWGTVTDIGGPAAGRVFGMVNTVGSVGATVVAPTMGYALKWYGFNGLFCYVAGLYVVTAILWSRVDCTQKLVPES